jgi:hypothetical protein
MPQDPRTSSLSTGYDAPRPPAGLAAALEQLDASDAASMSNLRSMVASYVRALRKAGVSGTRAAEIVEDAVRGAMPHRRVPATSRVETALLVRKLVSWSQLAYYGGD